MTYKEESYVLDTLTEIQEFIRSPDFKQLVKETNEDDDEEYYKPECEANILHT